MSRASSLKRGKCFLMRQLAAGDWFVGDAPFYGLPPSGGPLSDVILAPTVHASAVKMEVFTTRWRNNGARWFSALLCLQLSKSPRPSAWDGWREGGTGTLASAVLATDVYLWICSCGCWLSQPLSWGLPKTRLVWSTTILERNPHRIEIYHISVHQPTGGRHAITETPLMFISLLEGFLIQPWSRQNWGVQC
jgi:hypothetical protein